ncbi:cysteine desulfurase family protein [Streptococcus himalayensis]|uniref:cysteine desulfurase n=1 Tax=Streptococcus himalayensis TaxID=1888195 RepID=A0A917A8J8_9STRE|nr:cysteine desulfurase family protein [Streptococcus himalayensis]GGE33256.1 cysteine desulfurase [Streptococcus himalayensis]
MVYLDNAATTQMSKGAIAAMLDVMNTTFGNPSSTHHFGRSANKQLRESRQIIADLLETNPQHIFFTSGGTESNNTVLKGYALAHKHQGKHIISTAIEHHAVLETLDYLVEHFDFEVTYIQPENGQITAQQIKDALRDDTILVSTMYANNETGLLLPIEDIGKLLENHPAAFHVDAVQAIGKIPIYPEKLGIDFLSASAHKFHGPKGIGFLYARPLVFEKLLHGGSQEEKRRAGTENLAAIVGMATALQENLNQVEENVTHVNQLKQQLLEELAGIDFYLNEDGEHLPYVINVGFPKQNKDLLLLRLDLAGIAVSTGSACTAGVSEPSHVLAALYGSQSPRLAESIRISLSEQTTSQEITTLTQTLKNIIGGHNGI